MDNFKFNWQCAHCNKRNLSNAAQQIDVPGEYVWEYLLCARCNKESKMIVRFEIVTQREQ